jgi:hypothetical protein
VPNRVSAPPLEAGAAAVLKVNQAKSSQIKVNKAKKI